MINYLKTKPEYFEAVISGKKLFEIRSATDRRFEPGKNCVLQEYLGYEEIPQCPKFGANCPKIEYDPYNEQDYFDIPDDCERRLCEAYRNELYSGREAVVKIKDVFDLSAAGIAGYVAFTFDILQIRERKRLGGVQ